MLSLREAATKNDYIIDTITNKRVTLEKKI